MSSISCQLRLVAREPHTSSRTCSAGLTLTRVNLAASTVYLTLERRLRASCIASKKNKYGCSSSSLTESWRTWPMTLWRHLLMLLIMLHFP